MSALNKIGLLDKIYAKVGSMTSVGREASKTFEKLNAGKVGMKAGTTQSRLAARRTRDAAHLAAGKKPTRIAIGLATAGGVTAMRPNSNQSRTAYRGPMQTGRGVGRFA